VGYDEALAARVRRCVDGEAGISEQPMFGGLAFLVGGNMAVAASGQGGLLVRVDPATADGLTEDPLVEPMVMRGRPMRGWLRVAPERTRTSKQVASWVARGLTYARSLPPKA
jgi:hypothetical protein